VVPEVEGGFGCTNSMVDDCDAVVCLVASRAHRWPFIRYPCLHRVACLQAVVLRRVSLARGHQRQELTTAPYEPSSAPLARELHPPVRSSTLPARALKAEAVQLLEDGHPCSKPAKAHCVFAEWRHYGKYWVPCGEAAET
jgi:hypothetical protein